MGLIEGLCTLISTAPVESEFILSSSTETDTVSTGALAFALVLELVTVVSVSFGLRPPIEGANFDLPGFSKNKTKKPKKINKTEKSI